MRKGGAGGGPQRGQRRPQATPMRAANITSTVALTLLSQLWCALFTCSPRSCPPKPPPHPPTPPNHRIAQWGPRGSIMHMFHITCLAVLTITVTLVCFNLRCITACMHLATLPHTPAKLQLIPLRRLTTALPNGTQGATTHTCFMRHFEWPNGPDWLFAWQCIATHMHPTTLPHTHLGQQLTPQ